MAVAILALAALALLPGVASAQAGSPPAVQGVVVEAPPAPAVAADTLPRTGSDVVPMAIGAVALVLAGTMLVVTTRRRRDDGPVTLA
ncbi:MAG TPA: LPXTG cell wall anchor domain-containing protein [Acidimicrobiales bacterium]|nr:LPXTG cell wall anchor domain-containing protein [Acidimicrobiales bacterium]